MTQKIKKSRGIAIAQKNESSRNFFQKTFILLAILGFISFGFKAKAQTFTIATNNTTSSCTWVVHVWDASSIQIIQYTVGPGGYTLNSCVTGVPDHITVTRSFLGCNTILFGSSGTFTYTAVTPSCCNSSITCAGGNGNGLCGTGDTGDVTILVEIL